MQFSYHIAHIVCVEWYVELYVCYVLIVFGYFLLMYYHGTYYARPVFVERLFAGRSFFLVGRHPRTNPLRYEV